VTAFVAAVNRRTFLSLRRHRNYRLFFTGQVVSVTGTWMQNIATAWLVLELTHSPVAVGVLALCQFLPFSVFGLVSGVLVDRFDARRMVIGTQAASLVFAGALAALALGGVVELWEVYVLTALRGTVLVLDAPARQALTFQMVGRDELPNAVALNSSLFNAARVVGPAFGGVVVATAGIGWAFAANAGSFLAVLAALLLVRPAELFPVVRAEKTGVLSGTREAFDYLRRAPLAALALMTVLVVSTFSFNFNVLLPVLAQHTLEGGPQVFGIISAFFGAGALLGALLSASLGRATWKVLLTGTAGFGAAEVFLAPQTSVAAVAVLLFATGTFFTLWTSNANAMLQLGAPDALRGRVVGLYYFAFNGTGPAGGLLAGWLASVGGTFLALLVAGGAAVAMSLFALARLRADAQPAGKPRTVALAVRR